MAHSAKHVPLVPAFLRRRAVVYAAVTLLFAAGAVAGALAVGEMTPERRAELTAYVEQLTGEGGQRPELAALIRRGLWEHGVRTVGLMWLLGLSIIGAPFILGVVFLRGFALGFTTGFLVEARGMEGILLAFVGVAPHHLLSIPAVLLAGGAALSFSAVAAAIILGRRQLSALSQFATSTFLCFLALLLMIAASVVEGYITPVLIQAAGALRDMW